MIQRVLKEKKNFQEAIIWMPLQLAKGEKTANENRQGFLMKNLAKHVESEAFL